MTTADPALNIFDVHARWDPGPPFAPSFAGSFTGANIAPSLPTGAPEFDHWRVYRTIVAADPTITPVWSPTFDISGSLPAATVSYEDTTADQTGQSNYYWAVAFNADESKGGACQAQILQAATPAISSGPFSYDGTQHPAIGGCHIDGLLSGTLPAWWAGGPPVGGWYQSPATIGVPSQTAANKYGFTEVLVTNDISSAPDGLPAPGSPFLPGNVFTYEVDHTNHFDLMNGGALGFDNTYAPPASQFSQPFPPGQYGADQAPSVNTSGTVGMWALAAAGDSPDTSAIGSYSLKIFWHADIDSIPASFPTPTGGFVPVIPPTRPLNTPTSPQPVPLPCIPCCNSCCVLPCKPGSYQL